MSAESATPETQRLLRRTGLLYVVLVLLGMAGPLTLESLVEPGDAATTAENLGNAQAVFAMSLIAWLVIVAVDLAVSVLLYRVFAPAGPVLAALSSGFRLVYTVALAALVPQLFTAYRLTFGEDRGSAADRDAALAALESFGDAFLLILIFFGIHLVLLGVQVARTRVVPGPFAPLLAAAGAAYLIDGLANLLQWDGYGSVAAAVVLTPAVVGEVGFTLWLLFGRVSERGITSRP